MLNVVHVPYYYNVFNCVDCLLAKFSFSVLAGVRVLGLKENNQIHVKLLTGSVYSVYFLLSLTFTDRHGPAQEAFQVWCLAQEQFIQMYMIIFGICGSLQCLFFCQSKCYQWSNGHSSTLDLKRNCTYQIQRD